ncbi:hypothetical protein B0A53_04627 [Rhodotorula sp. CCFEE 5036]|nr:hypothetical protein B0A53_04627 [Rhodotorula sp. CCFEE 5036]
MAPAQSRPVNSADYAFASGQVLKATLIDPSAKWQEAMKLLGRDETNFVRFEPFVPGRPILMVLFSKELMNKVIEGAPNAATRKWVGSAHHPHAVVGDESRIIDDDLKHKMAGLDACSKEGIRYWEEQYERALQSGFFDSAADVEARVDLEPAVRQRIIAYLFMRPELYVCDFGAKTYNRDALDKQCPVQQGEEHVLNLEEALAHLETQSLLLKTLQQRRSAAEHLESITRDPGEWAEEVEAAIVAQKAQARLAASNASATAGPSGSKSAPVLQKPEKKAVKPTTSGSGSASTSGGNDKTSRGKTSASRKATNSRTTTSTTTIARGTTSARKENKDPNDDESNAQPSVSSSNFAMPIFGSLPPAPNAAQKPALPPMPGFGPVPAIPKTPAPPTSFNNYKYSYSYGAGNDLDGPDVPQKMFDETFDSDFDELEPIENWGKRSNKSTGAGPATKKVRKTY